jgi:hypothetical protein
MGRGYFEDLTLDPPLANLAAVTATVETVLWPAAEYTPITARDGRAGKIYRVTAGGIVSFATTGTLIITPRAGPVIGSPSLGANAAQTVQGAAVTNAAWTLDFTLIVRALGIGALSTVVGTGSFCAQGTGAASTGMSVCFGGTVVTTMDLTIASGITFGWTLSVAGSVTPQYAFIQPLN